jgi:thiamine biosynthesis protein ThiS
VQPIDQMAFMIGLPKIDLMAQSARLILHTSGDIVQCVGAINFWLTGADKVEVRAIENIDQGHRRSFNCVLVVDLPIWPHNRKRKTSDHVVKISITLNGEPRDVALGTSIAALAAEIGLNPAKIAVERNLEIVPRSTLANIFIEAGDQIEIVHFVGGG